MPVIAERQLPVVGSSERTVGIRLGRPRRARTGEWRTAVQVVGADDDGITQVGGQDALQSLLLAIQVLDSRLERSGLALAWLGEEQLGRRLTGVLPQRVRS